MRRGSCFTLLAIGISATSLAQTPIGLKLSVTRQDSVATGYAFPISSDGKLLSNYHVVHEAQEIRVRNNNELIGTAITERIAPTCDLAILRLRLSDSFGKYPTPFRLRTSFPASTDLQSQPIRIQFEEESTPLSSKVPLFKQAGRIRTRPSNDRIFSMAARYMNLLYFDAISYRGMSGAPVVLDGEVIGVFSGGLNQGGNHSWAIPVSYQTNCAPFNRSNWPPLGMVESNYAFRDHILQLPQLSPAQLQANVRLLSKAELALEMNESLSNRCDNILFEIDEAVSRAADIKRADPTDRARLFALFVGNIRSVMVELRNIGANYERRSGCLDHIEDHFTNAGQDIKAELDRLEKRVAAIRLDPTHPLAKKIADARKAVPRNHNIAVQFREFDVSILRISAQLRRLTLDVSSPRWKDDRTKWEQGLRALKTACSAFVAESRQQSIHKWFQSVIKYSETVKSF